jgi:hypothetical protein
VARSGVKVIGAEAIHHALVKVSQNIGDLKEITQQLDQDMHKFAHVDTGFMKSTVYHKRNVAGADAYYAGYEADRGGSHDYAQRAIDAFPWDKHFDWIVKPF